MLERMVRDVQSRFKPDGTGLTDTLPVSLLFAAASSPRKDVNAVPTAASALPTAVKEFHDHEEKIRDTAKTEWWLRDV